MTEKIGNEWNTSNPDCIYPKIWIRVEEKNYVKRVSRVH